MENDNEDLVYRLLADGHPEILMEMSHRACITYPKMSELVLVTIHRAIKEKMNDIGHLEYWISNTLEGLASKEPILEDELNSAYQNGKTPEQILHQTFTDLQKVRDDGMNDNIRKYEPLINVEEGFVYLTSDGEKLFD